MQHVRGGEGVVQSPVVWSGLGAEQRCESAEFVIASFVVRHEVSGQGDRVDHAEAGPAVSGRRGRSLEEADVEAGVVRHEHRTACEL